MFELPTYNVVDILVLIILVLGLLQGLHRKLSGEIARLIGIVVAVWAGWHYYRPIGESLQVSTRLSEQEAYAVAFFVSLIGIFLHIVLYVSFKGGVINWVGGAIAGFLRAFLMCAAVVFFLSLLPSAYINQHIAEGSAFGRLITQQAPYYYNRVRDQFPTMPKLPDAGRIPSLDDIDEEPLPASTENEPENDSEADH